VELGSALERLLCSPEIRKRMGKAGRAIYDCKFTLSRMMAQIQALYDGEMKRRDHAA
jgi:glycosyltransferase involved in cell wall biosynthesis